MRYMPRSFGILAAAAALSLTLAACNSQSPGNLGYMPSGASSLPAAHGGSIGPDTVVIKSTCSSHIHIILAGFVNCQFSEKNYSGVFHVFNHTHGLVGISPTKGTSSTVFTVTALLVGRGAFLVRDRRGKHTLIIRVKVRL